MLATADYNLMQPDALFPPGVYSTFEKSLSGAEPVKYLIGISAGEIISSKKPYLNPEGVQNLGGGEIDFDDLTTYVFTAPVEKISAKIKIINSRPAIEDDLYQEFL